MFFSIIFGRFSSVFAGVKNEASGAAIEPFQGWTVKDVPTIPA